MPRLGQRRQEREDLGCVDRPGKAYLQPAWRTRLEGNRIVYSSLDYTVGGWNARPLEGEARQEVGSLVGHGGGVHGVAFSPDGLHLASAEADGTVSFWDFKRALGRGANPPIHTLAG